MNYAKIKTEGKFCVIFENGRFFVSDTPLSQEDICRFSPEELSPVPSYNQLSISLDITDRCNLNCIHCSRGSRRPTDNSHELKAQEISSFLGQLRDTKVISVMGGEPLCRPDIVHLLRCFSESGHEIDLVTNLTILDNSHIACFAAPNLNLVVSLDGICASTHDAIRGAGTFEKTKLNLCRLVDVGLADKITISMSVMRFNQSEVSRMLEFGTALGISRFHFPRLKCEGNAKWNWAHIALSVDDEIVLMKLLYKTMKSSKVRISGSTYNLMRPLLLGHMRFGCPSLGKNVAIDAQGNVYPCGGFMSPDNSLGNLRDHGMSLESLLTDNPILQKFQEIIRHRSELVKARSNCPWRFLCAGGCPACAALNTGNLMNCDSHCSVYRTFFDTYVLDNSHDERF